MGKIFEIDGSTYTEEELIDILREQLSGLEKYSQYEDGVIEFCRQNKDGNLFFSVTPDDIDEEERKYVIFCSAFYNNLFKQYNNYSKRENRKWEIKKVVDTARRAIFCSAGCFD